MKQPPFLKKLKNLSTIGVNSKRFNHNVKPVNRNGERLLDLCCNHNLFIVNGIFGAAANICKTTCKDISFVDYTIVSADVFSVMHTFHIADFNTILSDIHSAVEFSFVAKPIDLTNHECENKFKDGRNWNAKNTDDFVCNININLLNDLMYTVNNLPSFTSENCKLLCDDLCNILKDSSRKTFGESTKGVNRNCKGDKAWFGTDCKRARYTFHKARKHIMSHDCWNIKLKWF